MRQSLSARMAEKKAGLNTIPCKPMPFPDSPVGMFVTDSFATTGANFAPFGNPPKQAPMKEEYNMEREQRSYLGDRLYNVHCEKEMELQKAYGLRNMDAPSSARDMIKRIQDGLFVINDEERWNDFPWDRIVWRDPAVKKDVDGFKAAAKPLNEARMKVQDQVRLSPLDVAFKAFEEFEAATFH